MKSAARMLFVLAFSIPFVLGTMAPSGWSYVMPGAINRTALVQDFAQLDQAYIPALAMTSQEQAGPSARAMAVLAPLWASFDTAWRGAQPADPRWEKDFDAVSGYMARAAQVIATGKTLTKAHEELEHVRLIFMELRNRNGIDYFLDGLTGYHEDMEAIVLAAKGKTPATLSAGDVVRIRAHLEPAKAAWARVMAATPETAAFGFSREKLAALTKGLEEEQAALRSLEQRLESGEPAELIKAALAIKPPFAKAFMQFGNFNGLKSA